MVCSARKLCSITGRRSEAGVTLIEVVAALGLLGLLLAVLSQLLHAGGRMWIKTDYAYQRQHQLQDLYTVLASDMRFVYCSPFLPTKALQGNDREIAFWRETERGLQQVTYRYDAPQKILYRTAGFWGVLPEAKPLITNLTALQFEYFETTARNWKYEWEPKRKTLLPSLVRITATAGPDDLGPIVIPLEAWHEEDVD
jgi:type II secretory pathway component PulJ